MFINLPEILSYGCMIKVNDNKIVFYHLDDEIKCFQMSNEQPISWYYPLIYFNKNGNVIIFDSHDISQYDKTSNKLNLMSSYKLSCNKGLSIDKDNNI